MGMHFRGPCMHVHSHTHAHTHTHTRTHTHTHIHTHTQRIFKQCNMCTVLCTDSTVSLFHGFQPHLLSKWETVPGLGICDWDNRCGSEKWVTKTKITNRNCWHQPAVWGMCWSVSERTWQGREALCRWCQVSLHQFCLLLLVQHCWTSHSSPLLLNSASPLLQKMRQSANNLPGKEVVNYHFYASCAATPSSNSLNRFLSLTLYQYQPFKCKT